MSQNQLVVLSGLDEFASISAEWDDLWRRSCSQQPTVMSAPLINWCRSFTPGNLLTTICVKSQGKLLAGIPLILHHSHGLIPCYQLPVNCWANSGDLLLDKSVDTGPTLEKLLDGFKQVRPGCLLFDEIQLHAPHWNGFREAVERRGGQWFVANEQNVGIVEIRHDWEQYQASWSGNHRGAVKRSYRKLSREGTVRAELVSSPGEQQLEQLIRLGFEIENRSWKGAEGSSVMQTPGMLDYMLREAAAIAQSKYLNLWFLYLDETPIAFEYCHRAKDVCFSHKIGYDPQYSKYGPGRLLRFLQLQHYFSDPGCTTFDMLGTLCDSKAKWATGTYRSGRVHVAVGGNWPVLFVKGVAWMHPRLKNLRRASTENESNDQVIAT